jgi:type VI protein secretion system component VasA
MTANPACFANLGDLLIFAGMMERLMGSFSSLNTFSRFTLKETTFGETTTWPARLGDHPLF